MFDGDVDAVWVENMNSVMDDNKLLTLPNGERIRLQPHCRLLFEVYNWMLLSPEPAAIVCPAVQHRHLFSLSPASVCFSLFFVSK